MAGMFKSTPDYTEVSPVKLSYNVGCLMDIPTGEYIKGSNGESILNGGMGPLIGIAGKGNTFKTTIMHFIQLTVMNHLALAKYKPYRVTYDCEVNVRKSRLQVFVDKFPALKELDILNTGLWVVTDKVQHSGNEWYEKLKEFLNKDKVKNQKDYTVLTPFLTPLGKPISTIFPTFGEIDSMSEFITDDVTNVQEENELGDSGGNTMHMRLGLVKTRLMMELPTLCNRAHHYMIMTAQIGREIVMSTGPRMAPPPKKMQHMRAGEQIKGISDKLFYLTDYFWYTMGAAALNNQVTKGPEFPVRRDVIDEGSSDLNIVTLKQLRSKVGSSGYTLEIIVSQNEGVLPSLTEFYYCKENNRFGISGGRDTYHMDLLPDVNIGRTTVRETIDTNPELCRAIKISADLLQISHHYRHLDINVPSPAELYEKLKEKYDWKILLNTRDWWTFDNANVKPNFLSTMDLIKMYNDQYVPFWLNEKQSSDIPKLKKEKK